jgi:hypothetical protein
MSKELLEKLKQKENFISSFTLSPPTDNAKKKKDYIQQGVQGLCHLCDIRRV